MVCSTGKKRLKTATIPLLDVKNTPIIRHLPASSRPQNFLVSPSLILRGTLLNKAGPCVGGTSVKQNY